MSCPRCASAIAPEQDWCLACGAPARTRLAPTPNWRAPIAVAAILVLLAGFALSLAFVRLTKETPAPVTVTTTPGQAATAAPAAATAPAEPGDGTTQRVVAPPPATDTQQSATAAQRAATVGQ
jgi:hypothetical protein